MPDWMVGGEAPQPFEVHERMAWLGAAGMAVAVVDGFDIAWEAGYGVADTAEGTPVDPGTLFLAGSISKSVTAAAAMRLVERGELDLDRDVNERLSTWRVPPTAGWQPVVTLRQLLSHTAGTTVHGFPGYGAGADVPSTVDVLDGRRPANTPPVRVTRLPGTAWRYSGGGTTIVQQLLVDVCGMPFPELMRELILDPAGMTSSTFEQPPSAPLLARCASGHGWAGSRIQGRWHLYPEMAAAGLWTTAGDLARFAREVQRSLRGDSRLLGADTARRMLTPPPASASYALGFRVTGSGDAARFGHGGDDEGFIAAVWAYPERGQAAAVMTNSRPGALIVGEMLNAVASVYGWPDWGGASPSSDGRANAAHAGVYEAEEGQITVAVEDDVWLEFEGQHRVHLLPQRDGSYRLQGLEGTVRIHGEELELIQDNSRLVARRVSG